MSSATSGPESKTSVVGPCAPIPQYMSMLSPEGWVRQAAANKPEASGKNLHWTADKTVELPIKMALDPSNPASRPPRTVMDVFVDTARKYPAETALQVKRNGAWKKWTWPGYLKETRQFAKACIALGFQPHDAVSIIGFNSPEWFFANNGAIFAGGMATGIYTTNNAEASK